MKTREGEASSRQSHQTESPVRAPPPPTDEIFTGIRLNLFFFCFESKINAGLKTRQPRAAAHPDSDANWFVSFRKTTSDIYFDDDVDERMRMKGQEDERMSG